MTGGVEKEAEVEIFPLGKRVRVRGIEVHNAPAERATAGQRTALNLAGIDAREITRGMVLAAPGVFQPTSTLDCSLTLLRGARPLKNHTQVHFHCGTAEMLARIVLLDGKEMKPGATGYVQLRLAEPGLFVPGDRYIIRQFSPVITIGGGGVIDNSPAKRQANDAAVIAALRVLEQGTPEARLELLARRWGEAAPADFAAQTGWLPAEVLRVANTLASQKRLVLLGQPISLLVSTAHVEQLAKRLLEQLESFHAANPLLAGVPKEDLRGRLSAGAPTPSPALFNALLQSLAGKGKIDVQGEAVRLGGRAIQMSPDELAARDQIAAAFEKAGLAVPSAREVLAGLRLDIGRAEKLLKMLVKDNVLYRVADDLIFHQSALRKLREILARRKAQNPRLSVPEFKDLTGLSRKYAIPLLEYLDRERVTRREGDQRIIL